MTKRPLSVTIIGWFIAIASLLLALQTGADKDLWTSARDGTENSLPRLFLILTAYFGFIVQIISAFGMLRGKNWARILYIGWVPMSFVVTLGVAKKYQMIVDGTVLIAPGGLYLLQAYLLFRPRVNEYFGRQEP